MEKKLPAIVRIMYLIPILLCVTFALVMVIQYTAVPVESTEPPEETGSSETAEAERRGQELLAHYHRQESLLKTIGTLTG